MSLRSDDLYSIVELYTEDNFRQLVVAAETIPMFLGGFCELEDHGDGSLVREAAFRSDRSMANGGLNAPTIIFSPSTLVASSALYRSS